MTTRDILDNGLKNRGLPRDVDNLCTPDLTLITESKDYGAIYYSEYVGGRIYISPSGEWYELMSGRDDIHIVFTLPKTHELTGTSIDWSFDELEDPEIVYGIVERWEKKMRFLTEHIHDALEIGIVPGETVEKTIAAALMDFTRGLTWQD